MPGAPVRGVTLSHCPTASGEVGDTVEFVTLAPAATPSPGHRAVQAGKGVWRNVEKRQIFGAAGAAPRAAVGRGRHGGGTVEAWAGRPLPCGGRDNRAWFQLLTRVDTFGPTASKRCFFCHAQLVGEVSE